MKKLFFGILLMLGVSMMAFAKPNIVILATGGTIAGEAKSDLATTGYKAGSLGIEVLINAVPELKNIANISGEQVANIDSSNMTDQVWLTLANKVNSLLSSSNVDGIVITHGTDTMEETAYFLNLVVKSNKPVVLTGAMRPATAISADGPKNLYNAVSLAGDKNAKNKGIMVAINDKIYSAREVSKTHTLNVETFKAPNSGEIGYIVDGKVFFNSLSIKAHTKDSPFNVRGLKELPKVDIVYTYSNDGSKAAVEAFLNAGAKGLVVAGSGAGSIHENQKNYLIELLSQKKLVVAKSSRVGSGLVPLSEEEIQQGFISANNLNPQKARVLLMLALTKTSNPKEIQKYFNLY
ncbi:type II asparaginase [Helicobacter sp. UBA3407]|uniref:type II asparaginase n=1 Tax=Helicobacter TaxID=209 RepID=UPI0026088329|nr:type II asparaginase [Helicobacter sp. UBA3407]